MVSTQGKKEPVRPSSLARFSLEVDSTSRANDDWVVCGRFGRPHGVRGEVRLWGYNKHTELLKEGMELYLGKHPKYPNSPIKPASHRLTLSKVRSDNKGLLLSFKGINQREQAQDLNHMAWLSPRSAFPPLAEDEFYLLDLIGAQGLAVDPKYDQSDLSSKVIETATSIGYLTSFLEAGAGDILIFESKEFGEVMVPNQDPFVLSIDLAKKQVFIRAIRGLLEGGI